MPIDLLNFVRKWNASTLNEETAAKDHFRDLCEALGVPHPTQLDEIGASYTYEKRVQKAGTGETGFADVWKRGFFAWEYKSKGGDLRKAYRQINEYREALDNPPLLIVCDFVRFEVHTNFENLPSRVYAFTLDDLLIPRDTPTCALPPLEVLRHAFNDFNQLRPGVSSARVTEAAAADFLHLAQRLELEKALAPERPPKEVIAHFLMRLVFCLFADSIGLLPNQTFRRLVRDHRFSPIGFNRRLPLLFEAMSQPAGIFGVEDIPHFNGGLFSDSSFIPLDVADLGVLFQASQHDWSHIEPVIFGTLFERSLDEQKRSMIGAHYTSAEDILLLVEPVVVTPLLRRWVEVQAAVEAALAAESRLSDSRRAALKLQADRPALTLLENWAAELSRVRILDPACGSGNFLYIALKRLLDLWAQARAFGVLHGLAIALDPIPHPGQLFGIETDFYAHEIASIVVWIGFLQWKHDHGVPDRKEPLLQKLTNIEHADAILRYDPEGKPYEPTWPEAEYIIGNPPFLGDKMMRGELGDGYVSALRTLYAGRVPGGADLVTYWFEKAREQIVQHPVTRAGLLATNSIRMVGNRPVLQRIKDTGDIFMAWSDRPWNLAGAAVRISMVAFDGGFELSRVLNGNLVEKINVDLTGESNLASALALRENLALCFLGLMKGGPFDIDPGTARKLLESPLNPNGRPNADVVKRRLIAADITRRGPHRWIIDFGGLSENEAAFFELPFEIVRTRVYPVRTATRDTYMRTHWWLFGRSRPALRQALAGKARYIVTPEVAKHRVFVWEDLDTIPDHTCHVIARDDDYFFGLLQSRAHELWSLAQGAWMGVGNDPRYSSERTFATFPFPYPPGTEPVEADSPIVRAIAEAARELVRLRDAWLNPPNIPEADLRKRTLTNLYNQRPTWLSNAHRTLDRAVFAAYSWPDDLPDQEILARLLALNHQRAAANPPKPKTKAKPKGTRKRPQPAQEPAKETAE